MNSSTCLNCSTDTDSLSLWLILCPFLSDYLSYRSLDSGKPWMYCNCISQYGCNPNQPQTLEVILTMMELVNVLSQLLFSSVCRDRQSDGPRFGPGVWPRASPSPFSEFILIWWVIDWIKKETSKTYCVHCFVAPCGVIRGDNYGKWRISSEILNKVAYKLLCFFNNRDKVWVKVWSRLRKKSWTLSFEVKHFRTQNLAAVSISESHFLAIPKWR